MKIKLLGSSLTLLLLFSLNLSLVSGESAEVTSQVTGEFSANGDSVLPVDPGEEVVIKPVHPPTAGPLSINYASNIQFGKYKQETDQLIFTAIEDTIVQEGTGKETKIANFVQITDLRGTAAGWKLSVKQNGSLKNQQSDELQGKLRIGVESVKRQHRVSEEPTVISNSVELSAEDLSFQELVRKESGTGMGTWTVFIGSSEISKNNVTLSILKNQKKPTGSYHTSLSWLLSDGL